MPKLPCVKPKRLIKVLKKIGFFIDRISGSHYILYKDEFSPPISVPFHTGILKQAKLSRREFIDLL